MDNSSCEWIRSRLPLYAGVDEGQDVEGCGSDVDLGDGDRRAIERHLSRCRACRDHGAELDSAMEALAVAASSTLAGPDVPSLWPELERRMAARDGGVDSAPASVWSRLDDDRPLRAAWLQDSWREVVGLGTSGRRRSAGIRRAVGVGLAASILMLSVVLPVAWRLRAAAEARELAFAEPVPPMVGPPAPIATEPEPEPDERLADLDIATAPVADFDEPRPGRDRRELDAGQLAHAGPIQAPTLPPPSPESPAPIGPRRFGFELELGTATPPDGRDARPIY